VVADDQLGLQPEAVGGCARLLVYGEICWGGYGSFLIPVFAVVAMLLWGRQEGVWNLRGLKVGRR